MAGIKKLNGSNPSTKRPIRVADIQDLWDALNQSLGIGTTGTPRILGGFNPNSDGDVSSGVVAFRDQLYFYDSNEGMLSLGQNLYFKEVTGDSRIFGDGSTQVFSYLEKATIDSTGATLIGTFTADNIRRWKNSALPTNFVSLSNLDANLQATLARNTMLTLFKGVSTNNGIYDPSTFLVLPNISPDFLSTDYFLITGYVTTISSSSNRYSFSITTKYRGTSSTIFALAFETPSGTEYIEVILVNVLDNSQFEFSLLRSDTSLASSVTIESIVKMNI